MNKAKSSHDNSWFDTLTDQELIDYCRNPPKDCEFTELKIAADILAVRYKYLFNEYTVKEFHLK